MPEVSDTVSAMTAPVSSLAPSPADAASTKSAEFATLPGESDDDSRTGVIFVSPIAGAAYIVNLGAGVCVCAVLGALLGLAVSNVIIGAALGGLVALMGGLFRRRRAGEIKPTRLEIAEGGVRFVLWRGNEVQLEAGSVTSIGVESEPVSGPPRHCWVVVHREGETPMRIRMRDAGEAARVASAMSSALGL